MWPWKTIGQLPSAFPGTHLLWWDFFFCVPLWTSAYQRNTNIFLCLLMLTIVYAAIPFVFIQNCQPSVFPACSVNAHKSNVAGLKEPTKSSLVLRMWRKVEADLNCHPQSKPVKKTACGWYNDLCLLDGAIFLLSSGIQWEKVQRICTCNIPTLNLKWVSKNVVNRILLNVKAYPPLLYPSLSALEPWAFFDLLS